MKLVPEVVGRTIARNGLLLQKGSPGILLGAGIVGMVGSTVLACRATLKVEGVLDDAKKRMVLTDQARVDHSDEYSERDRQRDITLIRFQSGVKIARLYAPAIIVGTASIACLTKSHNILTSRNAALTAAYSALEKGFNEYRARVVEKYGEEEDRNFRYGTRQVEIEGPRGGKNEVTRVSLDDPSIYARFFDSSSPSWNKEPEYNLLFLKSQQNYFNDLLKARGHVFLNEVYDELGIPRSKEGSVVGWLNTENGSTDNFVNFGIFDGRQEVIRDFVNGYEGAILLDFNVDGVIYDKIEFGFKEGWAWRSKR